MKDSLFSLIFFNKEGETIVEHHHSSGGGGTRIVKEYVNQTQIEYVDKIIKEEPIEPDPKVEEGITKKTLKVIIYILLGLQGIVILYEGYKLYQKPKNTYTTERR